MWWASGGPIVKPRQITNMALGARVMGGRGLVKGVIVDLLPICPFSTRFSPNFVGFSETGMDRIWEALAGRTAGGSTLRRGLCPGPEARVITLPCEAACLAWP